MLLYILVLPPRIQESHVDHKSYETTITESLAIYVDDEIMECDGRDNNKKTCVPIVKKDNKKGKNEIY